MLSLHYVKKGVLISCLLLLSFILPAQTSYDYYEKAYNAYKEKDYSSCVYYAKKAIELNSSYYDAFGIMGDAYYSLKDYRNAVDNYTQALANYSYSGSIQAHYYYWRASAKDKMGDYDGAISDYSSCISKSSSDYIGSAYWERGVLYNNKKDNVTAAKSDYESAVYYYNNDRKSLAILYSNISNCEITLGNKEKALEAANKAIQMDPEYYKGYMRQGFAYKASQKYSQGKVSYSKALNLYKKDNNEDDLAYIYYGLGMCHYSLFEYDEALSNLLLAIEKKPNFPEAYWNTAYAYYNKLDYNNAIKYYTLTVNYYLDDNQSLADIYRWRGKSYFAAKQNQRSIDDYQKSLNYYTADDKKASVYSDIAWSFFYMGNITAAISNIDKAIHLNPDDIYFSSDKASILATKKNYKEAASLFDKAIAKYPTDEYYYFKRGFFKWMSNDKTGAMEDFKKFKENSYSDSTRYMAIYQVLTGNKQSGLSLAVAVSKKDQSDTYKKWDLYNLACVQAIAGNAADALKTLDAAVKAGYNSFDWMQLDYELQNIQGKPEFVAFLKKNKATVLVKK